MAQWDEKTGEKSEAIETDFCTEILEDKPPVLRDNAGRFQSGTKPGPGRPPGTENKATSDARLIRRQVFEVWNEVDGPRILRELAATNPLDFLKLVLKTLPRQFEEAPTNPDLDEREVVRIEAVISECMLMAEQEEFEQFPAPRAKLPMEQADRDIT